jgi:hypothetical protein
VALGASTALKQGVTIKALSTNTGFIYVGGSTVSSLNGMSLLAEDFIFIPSSNLASIYIDSAVNGEGVCFIGG